MSRLDEEITRQGFILDSLIALRNILGTGDCNICAKKSKCEYAPKPGQLVRYNCPFYEKEENKNV